MYVRNRSANCRANQQGNGLSITQYCQEFVDVWVSDIVSQGTVPMFTWCEFIVAHSSKRDTVFVPFCGCGRIMTASLAVGRKAIGAEGNGDVATVCKSRMLRMETLLKDFSGT